MKIEVIYPKVVELGEEEEEVEKNFNNGRKFTNKEALSLTMCSIYKRSNHVKKDCWFKGKP